MNWKPHAARLAEQVTHPGSRWRAPVQDIPRHLFVPWWWQRTPSGWELQEGPADEQQWLDAAYADRSLITRVGPLHADLATPDDHPTGRPTSSATLPSLTVRMYQHARIGDDDTLLDLSLGSGYSTALAAHRLGEAQVTGVDIDPYLVDVARERLAEAGLRPHLECADATKELPGEHDRVVATVALRPIPTAVLAALRTGGRLVTTLAGTSLIITATKNADGGATGRVEWDRAGFMDARRGEDYPPGAGKRLAVASHQEGEQVSLGPYPVVDVANAWDLVSMLDLTVPGIEHEYREDEDQHRTALMAHPDGSWARAVAHGDERPTVHQSGPQRLWDAFDELRTYWLTNGELPVRGARVFIKPDGTTILARGKWHTKLTGESRHG